MPTARSNPRKGTHDWSHGATILAGLLCLALLAGVVVLRLNTGVEIKLEDLALPVLIFGFYLLVTGQITTIKAGGVTLEGALAKAASASVQSQISQLELPVESLEVGTKAGMAELDRMVEEGAEALAFRFGHGRYSGPAIKSYLQELLDRGAVRWIVFENQDGTFWGLAQAQELAQVTKRRLHPGSLATALNEGDKGVLEDTLRTLILADAALAPDAERRAALSKMEEQSVAVLPVVNEAGGFVGVVERSRLVASIVLEVDRQLE